MTEITKRLFTLSDETYRHFQIPLIPTVDSNRVIGVRTPLLRRLAKELAGTELANNFLKELPHTYYEENQLHAFLIEQILDFDLCIEAVEAFLPYVDNWSTCDGWSPKVFGKQPHRLLEKIQQWVKSTHPYTVRYGIGMLQRYFLDDRFESCYLTWVSQICHEEYYVRMMVACFFATALAKQYAEVVTFLEEKKLPKWTHNKTIQKAIESYRISSDQKQYLKTLKI